MELPGICYPLPAYANLMVGASATQDVRDCLKSKSRERLRLSNIARAKAAPSGPEVD
jgi:hypothetical protein